MSKDNYFRNDDANQFSFFRIPRALMADEKYCGLSTDAKLLYGLMLDRMGLSIQNRWLDEQDRAFIYFTLEEAQGVLVCGHNKAVRIMSELEEYSLIERHRQGQGKPAKIYVKTISTENMEQDDKAVNSQPSQTADLLESEKSTCTLPDCKCLDFPKRDGNYTKKNYTDLRKINLSINQEEVTPTSGQAIEPAQPPKRYTSQDSTAISGAVLASMSFVKQTTLARGHGPLNPPRSNHSSPWHKL